MSPPALPWRRLADAPDIVAELKASGLGFMAFGRHVMDAPPGASRQVVVGDHWWAIVQWDRYRPEPHGRRWVFAKDGQPTWSEPTHFCLLTPPAEKS